MEPKHINLSEEENNGITTEAFGPYHVYHFSRGLSLNIGLQRAVVRGGPRLFKVYQSPDSEEDELPASASAYYSLVTSIEDELGLPVVAYSSKEPGDTGDDPTDYISPPSETLFRTVGGHCLSAGWLCETLLSRFIKLEGLVQKKLFGHANVLGQIAWDRCLLLKNYIKAGKLSPEMLDEQIGMLTSAGYPMEKAFFYENGRAMADDVRSFINRACYHFSKMTSLLWEINQEMDVENAKEMMSYSENVDKASSELVSAIIACYSALDVLYRLSVYVLREPFGNPKPPRRLHFPDTDPNKIFSDAGVSTRPNDSVFTATELPMAIPNLAPNKFTALRKLRNDLVHNMSLDSGRPSVFIGVALPPISQLHLQYCMYTIRDFEGSGTPVGHQWVQHFYMQQNDAQVVLYTWLVDTWNCILDTTTWLIHYLSQDA